VLGGVRVRVLKVEEGVVDKVNRAINPDSASSKGTCGAIKAISVIEPDQIKELKRKKSCFPQRT